MENAVDHRELDRISETLDELSQVEPALAEIVDLKFFCGFSFAEIAGHAERLRTYRAAKLGESTPLSASKNSHRVCRSEESRWTHFSPDQWQALGPYLDQALSMTGRPAGHVAVSLGESDPTLAAQLTALLDDYQVLAQERFPGEWAVSVAQLHRTLPARYFGPYTLISRLARAEWEASG